MGSERHNTNVDTIFRGSNSFNRDVGAGVFWSVFFNSVLGVEWPIW